MIKEGLKYVVYVLIALAAWELIIKKFVLKSEYEEQLEEIE
ncbi:MAG: hypothetical protein WC389_05415 [Lutibacter sp.]|jgi:hypothetical protein